jgi:hypothetical protein
MKTRVLLHASFFVDLNTPYKGLLLYGERPIILI